MARIYHRPTSVNDYGDVQTVGAGNVLGDNSNGTYKRYSSGGEGSVGIYPDFAESRLGGKPILAVRAGHVERQGGLYNGWPMTYLRIDGQRHETSRVYSQTAFNTSWREKLGQPIYKARDSNWTVEDLANMATDIGGASGDYGPSTSKNWCLAAEVFILVVTAEALPTPYFNVSNVSTTNPELSATLPAAQPEQSSMMTFQVARDSSFTEDVRTYNTAYKQPSATSTTRYSYHGVPGTPSYADLGPGVWHIRAQARDIVGTLSEWSLTKQFSITLGALPTPSLSKPIPHSSSTTPFMIRGALVSPIGNNPFMPGDRAVGAEWEFSKSSLFDSGVVSWRNVQDGVFIEGRVEYDPTPINIEAGLYGYNVGFADPDQKLPQGDTIYARVRAADKWGNVGAWSTPESFGVNHRPFARNVTPTGGEDYDPVVNEISWEFADPWNGDRQSAYQVVVRDSGTIVSDTGKRYSTRSSTTLDIAAERLGKILTYEITLWDSDDVASASAVSSTFKYRRAPIVTVSAPVGEIDDGVPTVTWSSVFSESKTQAKAHVIVQNKTTGKIAYDSGTLVTSSGSHKIKSQLVNMSQFEVRVYVYDSGGLMGLGSSMFSTNFVLPPTLTTTALSDRYTQQGYVDVMWSGAIDPFFYEFRIYQREYDEAEPNSVEWRLSGTVQNPAADAYRDYTVSGNGLIEYAVTQVSYRFGSTVESLKNPSYMSRVSIISENYWLIIPGDESNSVMLHSVVDDSYTDMHERNAYQISGGGGTRVVRGGRIGIEGQLSCRVRSSTMRGATEQVHLLQSIGDLDGYVIMRDPFGNSTKVSLGDINVQRLPGVGAHEFADIEIPYTEVS